MRYSRHERQPEGHLCPAIGIDSDMLVTSARSLPPGEVNTHDQLGYWLWEPPPFST
jgi:hypothetical protein